MAWKVFPARGGRRGAGLAAVTAGAAVLAAACAPAGNGAASAASSSPAARRTVAAPRKTAVPPRKTVAAAKAVPSAASEPDVFVSGTDSMAIAISGPAPYRTPAIGGAYGGYIGMIGNWSQQQGCGGLIVWSAANSSAANTNFHTYHEGIGTGGYWFMGGPGVDPGYNGTTSEAYAWGERQAAWALADAARRRVTYPVLFMDIEIPGNAPAYTPASDNGWNSVYTSPCSGTVKAGTIQPAVDRADLDGFAAYLTSHSSYKAGVYSAPDIWKSIFGTGAASLIPNIYEWTYESFTASLGRLPQGWCLSGSTACASFFGGQTSRSKHALMWQWSGGGGSSNGYGDFDQIDVSRTP